MNASLLAYATVLTAILNLPVQAQSLHDAPEAASDLGLSTGTLSLLREEMRAIEQAMQKLIPHTVAGEWGAIATLADSIRDTYILHQRLTPAQRHELHAHLPVGFLELDQAFHQQAGRLAHAAHQRDAELVHFYIYRMNQQCTACHSRYALERFPGLRPAQAADGHQH